MFAYANDHENHAHWTITKTINRVQPQYCDILRCALKIFLRVFSTLDIALLILTLSSMYDKLCSRCHPSSLYFRCIQFELLKLKNTLSSISDVQLNPEKKNQLCLPKLWQNPQTKLLFTSAFELKSNRRMNFPFRMLNENPRNKWISFKFRAETNLLDRVPWGWKTNYSISPFSLHLGAGLFWISSTNKDKNTQLKNRCRKKSSTNRKQQKGEHNKKL